MGKLTYIVTSHEASRPAGVTRRGPSAPQAWLCQIAMALLLCVPAFSQSASSFKLNAITPRIQAPKKGKKAAPATPAATSKTAPANTTPSRYIGEAADFDAYVESISANFSMKDRATDPFGQPQDPDAKPVVKQTVAKVSHHAVIQATPFADIVRQIQVTTIMPGEKRFLIGTRSFKLGDRFPLSFRGKNINVEVSTVSSRQIGFRCVDNGETAALKLNLLPVGMTPGIGKMTAPGMVADRPNAPLEVGVGGNPAENANTQ